MKNSNEIAENARRRQKKQNEYIKEKYDRVSVVMQKGRKELIEKTGEKINAFINIAIDNELTRRGLLNAAEDIQEAPQRAAETPPEDNAPQLPPGLECPF